MYSSLDFSYQDDISDSDTNMMLTMLASSVHGLHPRLIYLLDNRHTGCLTYWPWYKCQKQGKKPINARFSILDYEKILLLCRNASRS